MWLCHFCPRLCGWFRPGPVQSDLSITPLTEGARETFICNKTVLTLSLSPKLSLKLSPGNRAHSYLSFLFTWGALGSCWRWEGTSAEPGLGDVLLSDSDIVHSASCFTVSFYHFWMCTSLFLVLKTRSVCFSPVTVQQVYDKCNEQLLHTLTFLLLWNTFVMWYTFRKRCIVFF